MRTHFSSDRMCLAAAGVDHEELCRLGEKYFGGVTKREGVERPDTTYAVCRLLSSVFLTASGWTGTMVVNTGERKPFISLPKEV